MSFQPVIIHMNPADREDELYPNLEELYSDLDKLKSLLSTEFLVSGKKIFFSQFFSDRGFRYKRLEGNLGESFQSQSTDPSIETKRVSMLRTHLRAEVREIEATVKFIEDYRHLSQMDGINECIRLMEIAKEHNSLKMTAFQSAQDMVPLSETQEDLHSCGNSACFAGHARLSPLFQSIFDFTPGVAGAPEVAIRVEGNVSYTMKAATVMTAILKVPVPFAADMIYDRRFPLDLVAGSLRTPRHILYRKPWKSVIADDVLRVLQDLKDGKSPEQILKEAMDYMRNN